MKKVFITGGSGTIGSAFIEKYSDRYEFYSYCRNESMQVALKRKFPNVHIILGSIEDENRLCWEVSKVDPDIIIHTAALKHIDIAENQPLLATGTNVVGSLNVINAANDSRVPVTVAISTDKACQPYNVYGYTKLLMERAFLDADNGRSYIGECNFSCCRFGNVAGSHGSVIPFWLKLNREGEALKLTDPEMTRLMFSRGEAVELVQRCIERTEQGGGFVVSKKMKAVNLEDLARVISGDVKVVGLRPGEKIHESLVSAGEIEYSYVEGDYVFLTKEKNSDIGSRLSEELSTLTAEKMSQEEMKALVEETIQQMELA